MSWRLVKVLLVLGCVLIPGIATAQSAIAGVARDSSGAVLPGVTVEASSPVLIEKVRTAITDASGQYRIEHGAPFGLLSIEEKIAMTVPRAPLSR